MPSVEQPQYLERQQLPLQQLEGMTVVLVISVASLKSVYVDLFMKFMRVLPYCVHIMNENTFRQLYKYRMDHVNSHDP